MKTKASKWIRIEDGIITDIHLSLIIQPDMTEAPWNSDVKLGEKINWYDKNYRRIADELLIRLGIRMDNRGIYYFKDDYRKAIRITDLDYEIPEELTAIKPIENEPCIWDGEKWIIDEEARAEIERLNALLSDMEVKEFVTELAGEVHEDIRVNAVKIREGAISSIAGEQIKQKG